MHRGNKSNLKFISVTIAALLGFTGLARGAEAAKPFGHSQLVDNLKAGQAQTVVTYGTSLTSGGAWVRQLGQALEARWPGKAKVINSGAGGMWSTWGVDNLDDRRARAIFALLVQPALT